MGMHAPKDFGFTQKLCNIKSTRLMMKFMLPMVLMLVVKEIFKVIVDAFNLTKVVMELMSRWRMEPSKVIGFTQHLWYLPMNLPRERKMHLKKKPSLKKLKIQISQKLTNL